MTAPPRTPTPHSDPAGSGRPATPGRAAAGAGAAAGSSMRLRELVFGASCAAAIRAAVRIGLPDALDAEPATAEALAPAVGAAPQPLRRLLRALACYDLFAEDPDGRFRHTPMSRLLRQDEPGSLHHIALWCTEPWTWDAWPLLEDAVRTGRDVFQDLYGKGFFEYLHAEGGESARVFDRAMTASSRQAARDVAGYLDLAGVRTVADIGGGQGLALAELLEKEPGLRGSLLDLPAVVAGADPRLREGGELADRVRLVSGDCREEVPVAADLYVLKNILEWDDDSTRATLRNVVAAAEPGARVLVIENLVDDSASMRFTTAMDLMLLLNVGGAKHTRASMTALMEEAGLTVGAVRPVNAQLHAFEAVVGKRPAGS